MIVRAPNSSAVDRIVTNLELFGCAVRGRRETWPVDWPRQRADVNEPFGRNVNDLVRADYVDVVRLLADAQDLEAVLGEPDEDA